MSVKNRLIRLHQIRLYPRDGDRDRRDCFDGENFHSDARKVVSKCHTFNHSIKLVTIKWYYVLHKASYYMVQNGWLSPHWAPWFAVSFAPCLGINVEASNRGMMGTELVFPHVVVGRKVNKLNPRQWSFFTIRSPSIVKWAFTKVFLHSCKTNMIELHISITPILLPVFTCIHPLPLPRYKRANSWFVHSIFVFTSILKNTLVFHKFAKNIANRNWGASILGMGKCVSRHRSGLLMDGSARTVIASSAARTEGLALLETLKFFKTRSKFSSESNSDQFNLRSGFTGADEASWEVSLLIKEAHALRKRDIVCTWNRLKPRSSHMPTHVFWYIATWEASLASQ